MEILVNYLQNNYFICSFLLGQLSLNNDAVDYSIFSNVTNDDSSMLLNDKRNSVLYDNIIITLFNMAEVRSAELNFVNWKGDPTLSNQALDINNQYYYCFIQKQNKDLTVKLYHQNIPLNFDSGDNDDILEVKQIEGPYICEPNFAVLSQMFISSEDEEYDILKEQIDLLTSNFDHFIHSIEENKKFTLQEISQIGESNNQFYIHSACNLEGKHKFLLFHKSFLDEQTYEKFFNSQVSLNITGYELGNSVTIVTNYRLENI